MTALVGFTLLAFDLALIALALVASIAATRARRTARNLIAERDEARAALHRERKWTSNVGASWIG